MQLGWGRLSYSSRDNPEAHPFPLWLGFLLNRPSSCLDSTVIIIQSFAAPRNPARRCQDCWPQRVLADPRYTGILRRGTQLQAEREWAELGKAAERAGQHTLPLHIQQVMDILRPGGVAKRRSLVLS